MLIIYIYFSLKAICTCEESFPPCNVFFCRRMIFFKSKAENFSLSTISGLFYQKKNLFNEVNIWRKYCWKRWNHNLKKRQKMSEVLICVCTDWNVQRSNKISKKRHLWSIPPFFWQTKYLSKTKCMWNRSQLVLIIG